MTDHKSKSNDHAERSHDPTKDWYDFEPPNEALDYEPVYATLHFYYDDPDSMRRFRLCNQAEDLKLALFEFDWWLRNRIKYNDSAIDEQLIPEDGIEWLQIARDQLWKRCADYGIDLTED